MYKRQAKTITVTSRAGSILFIIPIRRHLPQKRKFGETRMYDCLWVYIKRLLGGTVELVYLCIGFIKMRMMQDYTQIVLEPFTGALITSRTLYCI